MDVEDFEKAVTEILKEYFDHGDSDEVATSLEELNVRNIKHKVPFGDMINQAHAYTSHIYSLNTHTHAHTDCLHFHYSCSGRETS